MDHSSELASQNNAHSQEATDEEVQGSQPFEGIMEMIVNNADHFQVYVENSSKDNSFYYEMPCGLAEKLTSFEKLLIVKMLKPERIVEGIQRYLEEELGR